MASPRTSYTTPHPKQTPLTDNPETIQTSMTDLLGITHPIMLAGMGTAAGPRLAAAVTNAGGIGVIGGIGYTPAALRDAIAELKSYLHDKNAPFGVDLLIPQVGGNARKTKSFPFPSLPFFYLPSGRRILIKDQLRLHKRPARRPDHGDHRNRHETLRVGGGRPPTARRGPAARRRRAVHEHDRTPEARGEVSRARRRHRLRAGQRRRRAHGRRADVRAGARRGAAAAREDEPADGPARAACRGGGYLLWGVAGGGADAGSVGGVGGHAVCCCEGGRGVACASGGRYGGWF